MRDFLPTIIAFFSLAILGTAYFHLIEAERVENDKRLWFIAPNEINKIRIRNEKGEFLLKKLPLSGKTGEYTWDLLFPAEHGDKKANNKDFLSSGYKTENQAIDVLINSIAPLTASRAISSETSDRKEHGLAKPKASVEWETADGKSGKLNIGNFIQFSSSSYIDTGGDGIMTALMASIAPLLDSPMKLVDRIILHLDPDTITGIAIDRRTESFQLTKEMDGIYSLNFEGKKPCPAHPPAVDYLINQLTAMKADAVLKPDAILKDGTSLNTLGLDPPHISVKIDRTEPLSTLYIKGGNRVELEEDLIYLMIEERPGKMIEERLGKIEPATTYLYKIRAEQLLALSSSGSEYKSTTLFAIPGRIYDYFVVTKNNKNAPPQNITSRKLGDHWETGNEFKENLDKVRAIAFYSGDEKNLEDAPSQKEAGLSTPAYSIAFSYSINPLNHYYIGQDIGKDVVYVLLQDQSIVTVDKSILLLFAKLFDDNNTGDPPATESTTNTDKSR
jgi:hypothetical protein